jgi:cyclopropane-fatty-acyl-phospholipid synthase
MAAVDLDELPQLDREIRGFGHNRFGIVSIHDADYLRGEGSIADRIRAFLDAEGAVDGTERIELVTVPRFIRRTFNPVSFYYVYRSDGALRCAVAEVNNTFHERHLYVLDAPAEGASGPSGKYRAVKTFHVSPFNDMRGEYHFTFSDLGETMRIEIRLDRDGEPLITAWVSGRAAPLDSRAIRRIAMRYPMTAALILPRIHIQAARLFFGKRLRLHPKPAPASPMTIGVAPPNLLQRVSRGMVFRVLDGMENGALHMRLPDGTTRRFGDPECDTSHRIDVRQHSYFSRLALQGDVGFGESFTDGTWDTPDLAGLLTMLTGNIDAFDRRMPALSAVGRTVNRVIHLLRRNTVRGSRRNIQAHYDLGNDFYGTFLDPETMQYSCGIFSPTGVPLADAQRNKIRRVVELADIRPGDHVLEIGCGWGGFAIEAVRRTGCRVTGITVSEEQRRLARERVAQAGLEDRIDIRLIDYRKVQGRFDRIVSIEMLEAVGHAFYGTFFEACDRLLKPGGRVVLQVITIPDYRYAAYRSRPDWIQKHIFPGGLLPCLSVLSQAMSRSTRFVIDRLDNIGPHYAPTLRAWRRRFTAAHDELVEMGYDETFQRKWIYYLASCEAGFATRFIDDLQIVLRRSDAASRPAPPPESG